MWREGEVGRERGGGGGGGGGGGSEGMTIRIMIY